MGRPSRQKGARGERDFRDLLRRHGFTCERDGSERGDLIHNVPGTHIEVKRRETLAIPTWIRQADADAPLGTVAVVAFRANRQPWRVVLAADEFLRLKALEVEAERQPIVLRRVA